MMMVVMIIAKNLFRTNKNVNLKYIWSIKTNNLIIKFQRILTS
jgi:hypothetical protein